LFRLHLNMQYFAFVLVLALAEIGLASAGLISRSHVPDYAEKMWNVLYDQGDQGWQTLIDFENLVLSENTIDF